MKNILIIRFSSFGDIVQSLAVTKKLKEKYTDCKITWLTKESFRNLVELCPYVDEVITLQNSQGIIDLIKLSFKIRSLNFDLIYDAHSNLRSSIIKLFITPLNLSTKLLVRKKSRFKRFLLFKLKINKFPTPFRGMISYISPLSHLGIEKDNLNQEWNFGDKIKEKVIQIYPEIDQPFLLFAPSAAWEMKRWPEKNWKNLISLAKDKKIVLIGGPADHFIDKLSSNQQDNCINLSGKLTLEESCYLVSKSSYVISADTGLIHVADILGVKGLSLIGPTAFGFPSNKNIKVMEVSLDCRPCSKDGRGSCEREVYQECMLGITPENIINEIEKSSFSN